MRSIRRRLLLWLFIGLLLGTAGAVVAVYRQAWEEANALFDLQLQQMANAFPDEGLARAPMPQSRGDSVTIVQVWDQSGIELYLSHPAPPPQTTALGFSTVITPEGSWRVYTNIAGNYVVQVSQHLSARRKLAARTALHTILPLIALLPLLGVVMWIVVGRSLKPLNRVASEVSALQPQALQPLPERNLPVEVVPLVGALNDLLKRLGESARLQRSFIADAAHELRTPLTAVRLQTQLAERAASAEERADAFARLKTGIERASRLVQQLLILARTEPDAMERPYEPVDLHAVAREVIIEQAPIAEQKGVDLGLSEGPQAPVTGNAQALHILIGNLVDNAIRYTPAGGTVDVNVVNEAKQVLLSVTDTGPGIPADVRERVFDRFYRYEPNGGTGSGLGLSIVRDIAQRHGAVVQLSDAQPGKGLAVTVRFPKVS
jgi:two-component system, OmpR family, sensor kinase